MGEVRILSYANEMPTYMLHGLTLAAELLVQVGRLLAPAG
jgi:mannose/fructose/N-acetylgalactosamine-specific phosphotransferase system component IIC